MENKMVSLTTADMEKQNIDSTPEELTKFKKMQKTDLETTCYQQLLMLRELKAKNDELNKLVTETNALEIKSLRRIKEDYDELNELHIRAMTKIDSLTMTIKNETWKHEQELSKLINPVPKLVNNKINKSEANNA